MDPQIRNFRDFLQLYNKLTETCFQHCVDNFFLRSLSTNESICLDKCVLKFSNVNQRVMSSYIAEQSIINDRRMKEIEAQMKVNNGVNEAVAEINATTGVRDTIPPNIKSNLPVQADIMDDTMKS